MKRAAAYETQDKNLEIKPKKTSRAKWFLYILILELKP